MAKTVFLGVRVEADVKAALEAWADNHADGNRSGAVNAMLKHLLEGSGHMPPPLDCKIHLAVKETAQALELLQDPPPALPLPARISTAKGIFGKRYAAQLQARKEWELRWRQKLRLPE